MGFPWISHGFPRDFLEFPWVPGSSPIPAVHGIQERGRRDRGVVTGALGLAGTGSDRERCFWAGFDWMETWVDVGKTMPFLQCYFMGLSCHKWS